MGLFLTAAAFGAGYTLGRPDGRAQLQSYLRRAREWADSPEARRLRDRSRAIAGQQLTAARRRLDTRPPTEPPGDAATTGAPSTGPAAGSGTAGPSPSGS